MSVVSEVKRFNSYLCWRNLQFLAERIEPLWKKYECNDLILDEYRNRSLQPQPISLKRKRSTETNRSLSDSNNVKRAKYHPAKKNQKNFTIDGELTIGNCVEVLLNADKNRIDDLRSKALKYICENFETIPMDDIHRIDAKNLRDVLLYDQISADDKVIFERLAQRMNQNEVQVEVASEMLKAICLARIPIEVSCLI